MFVPNTAQGTLKLKIYSLFIWNWYLNRCLHFYLLNLAPLHGFFENKSNVFIHGLRAPVWGALSHTLFPSLCLLFPDSLDPSALESLFWLFFLPRSYPNHLIEYCKPSSPQHPWFPAPLTLLYVFLHSTHLLLAYTFISQQIWVFIGCVFSLPSLPQKRGLWMQGPVLTIVPQLPKKMLGIQKTISMCWVNC